MHCPAELLWKQNLSQERYCRKFFDIYCRRLGHTSTSKARAREGRGKRVKKKKKKKKLRV
jgi:hypothetical protein